MFNIHKYNEILKEIRDLGKKTQIIAIYGKGGIGKSFTLANLSHMMAEQGKRVLLIGCDPKSDTTSLLFGGKACPTIIETSTKKGIKCQAYYWLGYISLINESIISQPA